MVGRLVSFWDGLFSGAMLVSGSVSWSSENCSSWRLNVTHPKHPSTGSRHEIPSRLEGFKKLKKSDQKKLLDLWKAHDVHPDPKDEGFPWRFPFKKTVEFYGISLGKKSNYCYTVNLGDFKDMEVVANQPYDLCRSWHVPLGKHGCSPFPLRVEGAWQPVPKKSPTIIERMLIERVKLVAPLPFFFSEHLSSVGHFLFTCFFCVSKLFGSIRVVFSPQARLDD